MKTLEQFCKQNKPKRRKNKLEKYSQEIKQLYSEHYTIEQIQDFLAGQGVNTSQRYIYAYLSLNANKNNRNSMNKVAQKVTTQEPTGISKATQSFLKNLDKE